MTNAPDFGQDSGHLIERAARRLQEAGHVEATGLLPATGKPAGLSAPAPSGLPAPAIVLPVRPRAAEAPTKLDAPLPTPDEESRPTIGRDLLEAAGMIDWTKRRQRMSEEFRIIQGQLVQAMASKQSRDGALPNVVMITSARPGEGKTFSAVNLAGSLARYANRPVILVDTDSSRHTLSSRLKLDHEPGLLDLAVDPALGIESMLHATSMPRLHFLPIGGLAGVRAALSASTPITGLIERLARQYSDATIILDAPPCLSSSDPSTLAHLVGHAIMLVEAQKTQRAEVESALDLIDACPAVSLILTKVKLTVSDTFGAYGYY